MQKHDNFCFSFLANDSKLDAKVEEINTKLVAKEKEKNNGNFRFGFSPNSTKTAIESHNVPFHAYNDDQQAELIARNFPFSCIFFTLDAKHQTRSQQPKPLTMREKK